MLYKTTTVKAIAVKKVWKDSEIFSRTYTFNSGPLGSVGLDKSTIDYGAGVPYVLVNTAPTSGAQLPLGINQYFPNGTWKLIKIEMNRPSSYDYYGSSPNRAAIRTRNRFGTIGRRT